MKKQFRKDSIYDVENTLGGTSSLLHPILMYLIVEALKSSSHRQSTD